MSKSPATNLKDFTNSGLKQLDENSSSLAVLEMQRELVDCKEKLRIMT